MSGHQTPASEHTEQLELDQRRSAAQPLDWPRDDPRRDDPEHDDTHDTGDSEMRAFPSEASVPPGEPEEGALHLETDRTESEESGG
ncbi:hypothetical protein [Sciscionella sediminilitoris]|uniref:hypothetical protein n=1 Tax=Sciscionella sediminilitoris TaxID=1445613 RepID=UPI0004DF9BA9|nr:hypothetical protein [Sciscionella sp. SE31]